MLAKQIREVRRIGGQNQTMGVECLQENTLCKDSLSGNHGLMLKLVHGNVHWRVTTKRLQGRSSPSQTHRAPGKINIAQFCVTEQILFSCELFIILNSRSSHPTQPDVGSATGVKPHCSDITNDQLGISGETGHGGANLCLLNEQCCHLYHGGSNSQLVCHTTLLPH